MDQKIIFAAKEVKDYELLLFVNNSLYKLFFNVISQKRRENNRNNSPKNP